CRSYEFGCVSVGQCVPQAWRCDGETDCMDGSDEQNCTVGPCGPSQVACLSGDQCVDFRQLCDGVPHCADASDENVDNCDKATSPTPLSDRNTSLSCPEFTCLNGSCVSFNVCHLWDGLHEPAEDLSIGRPPPALSGPGGPETTVLQHHLFCGRPVAAVGELVQLLQWLRRGGAGLVRHSCAPCPISCGHISSGTTCNPDGPCFSGCWCPEGHVMHPTQRCVHPEECPCEVGGARYWPGQQVKVDCEICVCEGGRPQHCQPNPECSADCQLCHCLPNLIAKCAPYCPYAATGCPMGQTLVPGEGDRCCYCKGAGKDDGWSPEPEEYRDLPQRNPEGRGGPPQNPYLQIDLLQAYNITDARPRAKVFIGNRDDRGVAEVRLDRMVSAQMVRLLPHDFQNGIYLRLELMGCGEGHRWLTTPSPPRPVSPDGGCREMEFHCGNGRCVPAGPLGLVCDGVNDCGDGSDERDCGTLPSTTTPSPRSCPAGQFSCPPPAGCIPAAQRCDGTPHCAAGEDERSCHPHHLSTTQSDRHYTQTPAPPRTPSRAAVNQPAVTPTDGTPGYRGVCSSSLGLEDGRIRYGQLTSSTHRENNPADAGRLNIVPNVLIMEPGWSPLASDPRPYLQVDFLEPTWVSGVVTQGSQRMWGYLTKYRLAFALHASHFNNYTETGTPGSPAKVFEVRMVSQTPVTRWLGRLVRARYLRIIPLEFRHTFYLRAEILGCRGDELVTPSSMTASPPAGGKVTAQHCTATTTVGFPGLQNLTSPTGRPGFRVDGTTGAPGLYSSRFQGGRPGVATTAVSRGFTGHPGLQKPSTAQVCDGRKDCLDGSDEERCGSTARPAVSPRRPLVPSPCSAKQFSCASGECVHLDRRCDLHRDCVDGSDELDCVDCIMSAWTAWSRCSVSCGLGSLFRQRDIAREALPGGGCGGGQFDSRACFPRACPEWTAWSECDAPCGGGVRERKRSCSAPPPKNSGHDCKGMTLQTQSCNVQPCGPGFDTQSGCAHGMVLVTEEDCLTGRVENCPPTCSHLSQTANCTASCIRGCRCPEGLYLQEGRCVNASQCGCVWDGATVQPGQQISKDLCTTWSPIYSEGPTRARPCQGDSTEAQQCFTPCRPEGKWTRWTVWSECSKTCFQHVDQVGLRRRFRFCHHKDHHAHLHPTTLPHSNHTEQPPACSGEAEQQEPCNTVQCAGLCPEGMVFMSEADCEGQGGPCPRACLDMTSTEWSACSRTCDVGVRRRYRSGTNPPPAFGGRPCRGDRVGMDPCSVEPCISVQEPWGPWLACSVTCGGGYRSRTRGPIRTHGTTQGFNACNLQPCGDGRVCPPGQVWQQCVRGEVSCADVTMALSRDCTPGCQCPHGAVLQSRYRFCSQPQPSGSSLPCVGSHRQDQVCVDAPCDRDGGWGQWSYWTDCTKSCGGGVQSRRRECDNPTPEGEGDYLAGGWCQWSEWTPCSRTCGAEWVSRYRGCSCPEPREEGASCPGEQEVHNGVGVQIQKQPCPVISFCPDCGGGQEDWPCGKPCPRSCSDLHGDTECLDSPECSRTCGCPGDEVLQDGTCVPREECNCKYHKSTSADSAGGWLPWSPWSPCTVSCGGGEQYRTRHCASPPCSGLSRQSKTCNTQVCLEVGCPPGRLYRECERGEDCPFSCAQECPCLVDRELITSIERVSVTPISSLLLYNVSEEAELLPGDTLQHDCSSW
ncbi:hypothetical protein CRUP_033712, partial [Coryphaenoides rupestris]